MYKCATCGKCDRLNEKNWILDGPKWSWGTYEHVFTPASRTWVAGFYALYAFCSMDCYGKMVDPAWENRCKHPKCQESGEFDDLRCKKHTWIADEEIDLT